MIIKTEREKLEKLFYIDENNKIMAEFIIDYIDNAKTISKKIDKTLYNSIKKYFCLDESYIQLFEKNFHFSENIVKLNIDEYINNEYNKNIKLDDIVYENYKFEKNEFLPYEGFLCDEINISNEFIEHTKIGYFTKKYTYLTLSKDNEIWMLVSPHEINTMKESISKAYGNVITFGLGLGYYAYMCSNKDEVTSVTIVEKDDKIIELFKKFILPQFEFKEKITIIKEDALTFLNKKQFNYDYAFIDLWHDVNDGLELYVKTYNLSLNHFNTTFDFWIEKSMIIILRRCLITLIYETINNINYVEINNYYDYIVNRLKTILIDYQINNYDEINYLLSEKNIKELIKQI